MHTHAGVLYRAERIQTHDKQFRAIMMVLQYLRARYGGKCLERHERQVLEALKNVEAEAH